MMKIQNSERNKNVLKFDDSVESDWSGPAADWSMGKHEDSFCLFFLSFCNALIL